MKFDDGVVTLSGSADSYEAKEKAVLMAGNVQGVEKVIADDLRAPIPKGPAVTPAPEAPAATSGQAATGSAAPAAGEPNVEYYEIVSGDTLGKIAQKFYGKAGEYKRIFEANKEVIQDPNLIYPGQKIRIPRD